MAFQRTRAVSSDHPFENNFLEFRWAILFQISQVFFFERIRIVFRMPGYEYASAVLCHNNIYTGFLRF